jgi:predicted nuclease of predicted toxin-antitoxin system
MKFLADMGISLRTVVWMRDRGYDIKHLREEGLQRLPDEEIIVKANVEQRIILTLDLDFSRLLALSGEQFPSVILFRLGNENYHIINDRLQAVLSQCREDLQAGAIVSVSSESLRVRQLPIS